MSLAPIEPGKRPNDSRLSTTQLEHPTAQAKRYFETIHMITAVAGGIFIALGLSSILLFGLTTIGIIGLGTGIGLATAAIISIIRAGNSDSHQPYDLKSLRPCNENSKGICLKNHLLEKMMYIEDRIGRMTYVGNIIKPPIPEDWSSI